MTATVASAISDAMDHTLRRAELAAARRAHAAARHNHDLALLTGDAAALARAADDVERCEMAIAAAQTRRVECVSCADRYARPGGDLCERCASARPTARAA